MTNSKWHDIAGFAVSCHFCDYVQGGGSVENMRYDLDMISDIIMKETGKGAIKNGNVYRQQNRLSVMSK